jgi:hypothetical protein
LILPRDKETVFATPAEFLKHHEVGPMKAKAKAVKINHHKAALQAALQALSADRTLTMREYFDILCDVATDIEGRIDAAREELGT